MKRRIPKYLSRLDESQKDFITKKVQELGSLEDVKAFYVLPSGKLDTVALFACRVARGIYNEG